MSQENVEVALELIEASNRQDVDAWIALIGFRALAWPGEARRCGVAKSLALPLCPSRPSRSSLWARPGSSPFTLASISST